MIGIIFSIVLARISKEKFDLKFDDVLEIFIYSLIGGIIGARIYYCLFNIKYYFSNPVKIFAIRDGGLAIYGGIILGILVAFISCKIKKVKFENLLDFTVPYLALSQAIGRLGNFFNIEAYGSETTSFLRMGILKGDNFIEVHPCFLYEGIACILIFIILKVLQKRRKYELEIFADYIIFYGIIRFFIEAIRVDSLCIGFFKISQLVSVLFVTIGIIIHISKYKKCRIL